MENQPHVLPSWTTLQLLEYLENTTGGEIV